MKPFRDTLGAFATGVTVVTARAPDGELVGITANSFNAVSLDPQLVLVSFARSLRSLPALLKAPAFAINLLCHDHRHLSQQFARPGDAKWDGVETEDGLAGSPLLCDRLAHFECSPWATYDGGDHVIVVGKVEDYGLVRDDEPLVFFRGAYRSLSRPQPAPDLVCAAR